jgi:hypothetical protein
MNITIDRIHEGLSRNLSHFVPLSSYNVFYCCGHVESPSLVTFNFKTFLELSRMKK